VARDIIDDRLIGALHLRAMTRSGLDHDPLAEHTAIQAGTLAALMAGGYEGDATLAEVLRLGDLGIGTIQQLGGELIVLDGECWLIEADGTVIAVDSSIKTPFAVVCAFRGDTTAELGEAMLLADLSAMSIMLAPARAPVLAIRLHGSFVDLHLRSVARQSPPYVPLDEVVAHQTTFQVAAAVGTLVGFHFPDASAGIEVPGFHFHFISDDRTVGGHVIDATAVDGLLEIDGCDELHVELPAGVSLGTPGAADRAQIERIEGAGAAG